MFAVVSPRRHGDRSHSRSLGLRIDHSHEAQAGAREARHGELWSGGKKAKAKIVVRTSSFDAVVDPSVAPRVLILGSHPSSKSLEKVQYYGRRTNAFWWLVADALGFAFDPKDVKQAPGNIKVLGGVWCTACDQAEPTPHARRTKTIVPRVRHHATTT